MSLQSSERARRRAQGPNTIPGKVMEQLLVDTISKHMKYKKVIERCQHKGMPVHKGKACLANLMAFYDGMTGWGDEGRAGDVVSLDFRKALDTVSRNIL